MREGGYLPSGWLLRARTDTKGEAGKEGMGTEGDQVGEGAGDKEGEKFSVGGDGEGSLMLSDKEPLAVSVARGTPRLAEGVVDRGGGCIKGTADVPSPLLLRVG